MTRTKNLADLQSVDLRRDEALSILKRVTAAMKDDAGLPHAEAAVGAAERKLHDIDRHLRLLELERQALKERVTGEERKLYGGTVKSPKELQGFEREVSVLKRQLAELDDTALEQMLARDEAVEELGRARAALAATGQQAAADNETFAREKVKLTAIVRRLDLERSQLQAGISPADLDLYERLRQSKSGRAVSQLQGESCGTCGMELPRHTRDEIRSPDSLVFCTGCGRIVHG
jgi:uncharacterized protein